MDKRIMCKAVGVGFETALAKCMRWNSNNTSRRNPVETVVMASVAEALGDALAMEGDGPYLTLEQTFSEIVTEAAAKVSAGAKASLKKAIEGKPQGRVDIVLWNTRWQPRVAIEIKTGIVRKHLRHDAERVIGFAKHLGRLSEGSMRYGIVGTMYWYATPSRANIAEAGLKTEMEDVAARHKVRVSGGPIRSGPLVQNDYGASVFLFEVPR